MIFEYINEGLKKFWEPSLWLAKGLTWEDLSANVKHSEMKDMFYAIPLAFLLTFIRYGVEKYILCKVGFKFGIRPGKKKQTVSATTDKLLETAWIKCNKKFSESDMESLTKKVERREIERWLRTKKSNDKTPKMVKFCETGWRMSYYAFSLCFGLYALWDKDWFMNLDKCWETYPFQSLSSEIWWYYIITTSFYLSLIITQFFDVKRNDFWPMFFHHFFTIILLNFSWAINSSRFGSHLIFLHDISDFFIEGAKLFKYIGFHKICDVFFVLFASSWFFTRLFVFPYYVIYSGIKNGYYQLGPVPFYLLNGMMVCLFVLHIFWSYLIFKSVIRAISVGTVERDTRSSSEADTEDEQEGKKKDMPKEKMPKYNVKSVTQIYEKRKD